MKSLSSFLGLFPNIKQYSDFMPPNYEPPSVFIELESLAMSNIVLHKQDRFDLSECYPKGYQLVSGEFPLVVLDQEYTVGMSIVKCNHTHFLSDPVPTCSVEGYREAREYYKYFENDPHLESLTPEQLAVTLYTSTKTNDTLQSYSETYEGGFSFEFSFSDGCLLETISSAATGLFSYMKDNGTL